MTNPSSKKIERHILKATGIPLRFTLGGIFFVFPLAPELISNQMCFPAEAEKLAAAITKRSAQ